MTTIATAAMINNKVTTNDWFLGFTVPPNDNSNEDYTNMSIAGIVHSKILYISLILPPWSSRLAGAPQQRLLQVWMWNPTPLLL
jgi:hypothetical protein